MNNNFLNDEFLEDVTVGMKIVVEEEEQSWWKTLADFFFKTNS